MPMNNLQGGRVTAMLGPTNTGKTHFALERMMGHRNGIMGFPLRLLARENYDRAARIKGAGQVALVTGEEKIVPPHAKYFFCTVESMPVDLPVAFLAVDEIQMAADPERGHIFTNRLLNARGEEETLFLGADTIRPILRRLIPGIDIIERPRLSTLTYTGPRKVTRLQRRSAVVAFTIAEVYRLAELIRQQRGGAAIVMGALSPRTRNAQVELFQSGEVDYLVATDAIGMGLNLDVGHVSFASLSKFDGRANRHLMPAELAQIAGRAGRHLSDGSFGTTAELGSLDPDLVESIENHRFDPVPAIQWRNDDLDFSSPEALLASLDRRPDRPNLIRVRNADDRLALTVLLADPDIARDVRQPRALALLWEVAQIPDFGKIAIEMHSRFLGQIYRYLLRGPVPQDWVAKQINRVAATEGDIDTLMQRIAQIRIWTYIAHRPGWVQNSADWQDNARQAEDRLSDALHEGLTRRFIDKRQAMLVRRLADGSDMLAAVTRDGTVIVEGHPVGRVEGFTFAAAPAVAADQQRVLLTAARRALTVEWATRVRMLIQDRDDQLRLDDKGRLLWRRAVIGQIAATQDIFSPTITLSMEDEIPSPLREQAQQRVNLWVSAYLKKTLKPLADLAVADLPASARAVAFRLRETAGLLPQSAIADLKQSLSKSDRQALEKLGVRFARYSIWLPALDQGPARRLLRTLVKAPPETIDLSTAPLQSVNKLSGDSARYLSASGLRAMGGYGIRPALLEKIGAIAATKARQGSFVQTQDLLALTNGDEAALQSILTSIGYRCNRQETPVSFSPKLRTPKKTDPATQRPVKRSKPAFSKPADPNSPFAMLAQLRLGKK